MNCCHCSKEIIQTCCWSCQAIHIINQVCHDCIWIVSCGRCGAKKEKKTGPNGENDICAKCELILLEEAMKVAAV